MPELPDVEFIKRRLSGLLVGATITAAHSTDRRILRPQSPSASMRSLVGHQVLDVVRRGKWLRVLLDDETRLFSHLGMTGWWEAHAVGAPNPKSERARLDVVGPDRLARSVRYLDSRRFGRLLVASEDIPEWTTMGPDPLVDGLSARQLADAIGHSSRSVKDMIMDQTVIAGIGNIIAVEALWHARIDPRSNSLALSAAEVATLSQCLLKEIRRELKVRLKSESDDWRDVWSIYGRVGKPCPGCGDAIASVVVAGRTSAFCKKCQTRRKGRKARP